MASVAPAELGRSQDQKGGEGLGKAEPKFNRGDFMESMKQEVLRVSDHLKITVQEGPCE